MRITRVLAAAAFAASSLVVATSTPSAAAPTVDLSITSGPPGVRIEVTAADCSGSGPGDTERILSARLISGSGADARLAAAGTASENASVPLLVPDWLDASVPAVVEASCLTVDYGSDGPVVTETPYEPAPFDVEPGPGPSTQTRTFSRTSLLAGQGFRVNTQGCSLSSADGVFVDVAVGADLSARTLDEFVVGGDSEVGGGASEVEVLMTDAGFTYDFTEDAGGDLEVVSVNEQPNSIGPGTYTVFPYCYTESELLFYEPQIIELIGSAPTGSIDLTSPEGTKDVTVAGTQANGTVEVALGAFSLDDRDTEFGGSTGGDTIEDAGVGAERNSELGGPAGSPFGPVATNATARPAADASPGVERSATGDRALPTNDTLVQSIEPNGAGDWSHDDTVEFERGAVEAFAVSGDPFADGFAYDPQVVGINSNPVTSDPTEPTDPRNPGAAPPANAVPGRPNYTG